MSQRTHALLDPATFEASICHPVVLDLLAGEGEGKQFAGFPMIGLLPLADSGWQSAAF